MSAEQEVSETLIYNAARAAHEVNKAYCHSIGDDSQVSWENAESWQKDSAIAGVRGVLKGNNAEQSHEDWMAQKIADGWTFGEVKDADAKTHPCLVPYADLPENQRQKDFLFVNTVLEFFSVHGVSVPWCPRWMEARSSN